MKLQSNMMESHKYANKIGTDATGVLRIRKYDDGSVKKDIIGVK